MMRRKKNKAKAAISVVFACTMLFGATGAYALKNEPSTPPKYKVTPQMEQDLAAQKTFGSTEEYAAYYNLTGQAVSSLNADMQEAISLVKVWPGTVTRREVGQGVYAEFWTRTQRRPTGLYVWSEMLLTNGKEDDSKILVRLKTPDFPVANGAISLPESAVGSVAGGAWSGFAVTEQQKEGVVTYIQTKFTATVTLGDTTKTITPICTMVSNAPKGNQYRVGLIHAVWNGKETQEKIPIPQAPDTPGSPTRDGAPAAPAADFSYIPHPVYNPQAVYQPNADGVLTIPFSVDEIKKDTFLCLGQVPCITKNADAISVQVRSESGNGVYVLVNETDLSSGYEDYCFLDWCDNDTPGEISGSFDALRDANYNDYTGNFYIYIGAKAGTDLTLVRGTITIQAYTNNASP